jgi:hypothetical protein
MVPGKSEVKKDGGETGLSAQLMQSAIEENHFLIFHEMQFRTPPSLESCVLSTGIMVYSWNKFSKSFTASSSPFLLKIGRKI